jgi:hypothetical protein
MVVEPVLTVDAPKTAKFPAEPSIDASDATGWYISAVNAVTTNSNKIVNFILEMFLIDFLLSLN